MGAVLAGAAVIWVFLVALWGVNGVFSDGHYGSVANIGTIGYNMTRYHTIYAFYPFFEREPPPGTAYMTHPLGLFWMAGILIKLLGAHNWVLRLPAIVYVTLTAFFLYRAGRSIWGPLEGALTALAYTTLPITLGFANYHDLEQPLMLGCVVATWGYARYRQSGREVYALGSVVGFAFAILHDWEAYIWGATFLPFLFLRAFVVPERWLGGVDTRRIGRYWAMMSGTAVLILMVTIALVMSAERVPELLSMYQMRSAGGSAPLSAVLQSRHIRIELMFTALAILMGKIALPVIVGRFFVRRNDLELLPIFLLIVAVFYYTVFKQGADIHIFWPHPFATYFGMAVGALAATIRGLWGWAAERLRERWPSWLPRGRAAPWVALGLVGLPTLLVLRDGASMIRFSRETGGRFIENHLQTDIDKNVAIRWFLDRFPSVNEKVAFHPGTSANWATQWEIRPRPIYQRQPVIAGTPPMGRVYMMDTRFAPVADLREAAKRYHVHAVNWYWLIDRSAAPAPLEGFSFEERDPGLMQSLSQGATEPLRRVVPDPWVTWEWRALLGLSAPIPTTAPQTLEQIRIAHNMAVTRGDKDAAARLRAELAKAFNIRKTAKWSNGLELLGTVHHTSGARSLTPHLLVGTNGSCAKVGIKARVTKRRFLSTLPVDPAVPDIAYPPPYPCELWRQGHIYAWPVVYRHRPGHEEFTFGITGWVTTPAPKPVDGPAWFPMLVD